jgi:Domain of unknown function (DUF3576)
MTTPRAVLLICGWTLGLGALAGCSGDVPVEVPGEHYDTKAERDRQRYGSMFGNEYDDGIVLFSSRRGDASGDEGGGGAKGIGVNAYLWRAALETVQFMPLVSADPFGGTIITDWYAPPETPDERFKMTVYVLDRQLRADGVGVSVFRQVRGQDGAWVDAAVDPQTATGIEDRILTRARELRIASAG